MAYCPSCGGEFVEGVSSCPDCEVPVVDERPEVPLPAEATREWETVLETGDPALLAAAKSALDGAGVPFVVIGEGLQNLEGMGVLGSGYNVVFGGARVRVPEKKAREARALLAEEAELGDDPDALIRAAAATSEPGEKAPAGGSRGRWGSGFVQGAGVGLLIGILGGLAISAAGRLDRRPRGTLSGESKLDSDGDGRPDSWARNEGGVMRSLAQDRNYDGERDAWVEFDRYSRRTSWRGDQNFDGEPDSFVRYQDGRAVSMEEDLDFDGAIDRWTDFGQDELPAAQRDDSNDDGEPDVWADFDEVGVVAEERFDTDYDGTPDGRAEYRTGRMVARQLDTDYDGTFDLSITYRNELREQATWEARPGAPARQLSYRHGTLHEELRDRDGDGSWDLRVVYDPFEFPVEESELRPEPPP